MEKAYKVVRKFNVVRSIFQSWELETIISGDNFLKSYHMIPWLESKSDSRYPKTMSLSSPQRFQVGSCYLLFFTCKKQATNYAM